MSGNQKQPAAGGPQTQARYSPYTPIIPQQQNSYAGSDAFHNSAPTYVTQTQAPNQGPGGLRSIQTTGPPNQSSTPPNTDLKVPNLQGQMPQMQFVQNSVRPAPAGYFSGRGAGGPPTAAPRMPNQQHRAQGPPQLYQAGTQVYMQPLFIPQPSMYYNQRPPANMMGPQSFTPQVYTQPLSYQGSYQQTSSGVPFGTVFQMYPTQTATAMPMPPRTPVNSAAAVPTNAATGNLQPAPLVNQQGPTHNTYSRSNQRQRRPNALSIIDPNTGEDKLNEIFDENASHPASGESSARQTPQPAPPNKEVQAAFAKQVAQVINEDKQQQQNAVALEQPSPLHEAVPPEHFDDPPPSFARGPVRYDVQNSVLQYDAKEFVSSAAQPFNESTPIVSANSDAAEVILPKKDRESPVKSRKQGQRDLKTEPSKEFQPKETECDKNSSIVKEEVAPPVPQPLVNTQPPLQPEPSPPVTKEPVKEAVDKKGSRKPVSVDQKSPEPEIHPQPATSDAGKSKGSKNKNVHNQNGKAQTTPQVQPPQQQPQQQPPQPAVAVPAPQPPKANNKSNKFKEINMKGANKEGTDMDAFNDNSVKTEINANILPPNADSNRVVANDVVNANPVPQVPPPTVVPPTLETDISEKRKDSNENVTTIKSEPANVNNVTRPSTATPAVSAKPVSKPFDVTSIVRDSAPKVFVPNFPKNDGRDETDRAVPNDKVVLAKTDVNNVSENAVNDKTALVYKADQWAPDRPDGKKVYAKEFLLALKNRPASRQKPDNIPDSVLQDERNRQMEGGRLSMGGRTDFNNPPFPNYGSKSGSQRGTLPKRNSRGGDKISGKPQAKVSISLRGDVKLHESENAWKPARLAKGESRSDEDKKTEVLYRKVRSVLNKLTPQKFETLVNQVRQLQIDTKERLQGVINLVFEKAIDEPNFSVAYAMMCKEIQNMQVSIGDEKKDDKKNVAFRTLLVTRCQMEFEKNSIDESERNAKVKVIDECTDPEKKKELTIDLEEYDRRIRMKSVGCIRFIGELFKQQMLTASIMKRCLQTLLDNKDEESLECLCKLLTTVGRELEMKSNDLSSIFEEMKQITAGKRQKVSSRIRFMLQDVIDLRDSKWIPRRGDLNPKTMDQIQKEAETEQLNVQVMNMNQPPRKDDRGSRGAGPRHRVSDDGWTVNSRNNRSQQFTVQADKMRMATLPLVDEPLGSRLSFATWGKGAVGVKSSQPPLNTSTNIYAALDGNVDMDRRPLNSRGNKDPYSSKGSSMERNIYNKGYDGRGSRSGSQHRESPHPMRSTGPPPSSMMPPNPLPPQPKPQPAYQTTMVQPAAPTSAPPASALKLSEEQIERRIRNSLDEFIAGCCTSVEYCQEIAYVLSSVDYSKVVLESYNYILEKSQTSRLKTGELFATLIMNGNMSIEDFCKGFEELIVIWEDLVIDIPQIWDYFAEDIVSLLLYEVLPFLRLKKLISNLIQANVAKKLLKSLFSRIVKEKGPNFLQNSLQKSDLQLSDFMPSSEVQSFVVDNNLQFLVGGDSPVGDSPLSIDAIQKKLSEFLQSETEFDDIVNWISANVGDRVKDNKFIRALATAIFENSISKNNNKLLPELLANHTKLIQKYVDNSTDYELQCLYALQSLIHKLEHPQGLLLSICDKLYEDSTFCQESFIAWESSTDPAEQEGKGVALKQLTSFFTQLKENEEDDEYSSNSEDA